MEKYIERPGDEFYNIGHWSGDREKPYPIIVGELVGNSIVIHEPEHFKPRWPTVSPRFFVKIETDKTALTYEEYKNLFPDVKGGWANEVISQVLKIYNEDKE